MGHKILEIKILNYKSITSEVFELSEFTPLVGYNNAGKSNILSAIKWLLRKSVLTVDAFNNADNPIIVEGKISGIDDDLLQTITPGHRTSIEPYISNEEIRIKRVQNIPSDTAANIRLFVLNPAAATPDREWVNNPTGIDNAINALFPEPIQIGAMENAEEDVSKSKATTTIGKLLGEIIGPIEAQYGAHVQTALDGLKNILDAEGLQRAPELTQFDTDVNAKIDNFFPDVQIKLHVPTPELKEVFNKGTIKIYEPHNTNGRDISSLGHGAQRSIQMALIRHLAEIKRTAQNHLTTTLLLIDEPELYLHPQAIEIVRDALKLLSNEGYQVIFSTHSPLMITHKDVGNTILIRKSQALGTHTRRTLKSAIPQIELDSASQIQLLFSLSNSSNILFSEKVFLTEGITELRVLPKIFDKIMGASLGIHKCCVVKQGGVASTRKSMRVLDVMDLPNKAIVDLDYIFKLAIRDGFLAPTDPDVTSCHQAMQQLSNSHGITLGGDGWPEKRNSSMSPSEAFALLATDQNLASNISNLHDRLKAQNIWVWKKGAIEDHLGITSKSEAAWANFCNQLDIDTVENTISDHTEVIACMQWLVS
jgi:putative ATP-dependent endonuclease of OLD family